MKSVGVGKLWLGKLVDITCQVPFQKVYLEGFFLSRDSFEAMTMSLSSVQDAFRRKSCSMVLKLRSNTEEQANRHFKENASNPLEHAKTICTWYFFFNTCVQAKCIFAFVKYSHGENASKFLAILRYVWRAHSSRFLELTYGVHIPRLLRIQ